LEEIHVKKDKKRIPTLSELTKEAAQYGVKVVDGSSQVKAVGFIGGVRRPKKDKEMSVKDRELR
jgi:hypothetical protein